MWAMKKEREEEEIKDAYPKKVRHMLKSMLKKEIKMHTQKRYATCPQGMSKKREKKRERQSTSMEKNEERLDHTKEFIHYPPKIFHTAPLDQIV